MSAGLMGRKAIFTMTWPGPGSGMVCSEGGSLYQTCILVIEEKYERMT